VAQLLINSSTGPADATRASIPFHIAANGSVAVGVTCAITLAGDATEAARPEVIASVRGVGVPPLAELVEKCRAAGVTIHV
jgi:predicted peroxiredoxin